MVAEKGQGEAYSVRAFLAAQTMPDYVRQLGSRFDIDCHQVSLPE
jgi:hypothetical protein